MYKYIFLITFLFIFLHTYVVYSKKSSEFPLVTRGVKKTPIDYEVNIIHNDHNKGNVTASNKQFTNSKKDKTKNNKSTTTSKVTTKDTQCNNDTLEKILKNNILETASVSKRAIYHTAVSEMGEYFNVICSEHSFSFLANAQTFCHRTVKKISCLAYK
uniref:Ground-like domain-containing protein n=1 Tax=Strongyloides venezuelensis TaxID=75913 RepID=A0A0K0G1L1_STRVS